MQCQLLELEDETMGADWRQALNSELQKPYFAKVCLVLNGTWSIVKLNS